MASRDLVIGGLHAVRLALELAPGDVLELWVRRGHDAAAVVSVCDAARRHGVAVQTVDARALDRLCGDEHHQGIALRRRAPATLALDALLEHCAATPAPLLLVLDGVQDPRNFGACLRAADGAGVAGVVYPRERSAPLSAVVAKAASGALDSLRLAAVPNLVQALRTLRTAGIWITGTAHDADADLYDVDLRGPAALVLGNEGSGMRRLTREHCDTLVRIPMHGRVPSLNVATAAAVCLYEARRQRGVGGTR